MDLILAMIGKAFSLVSVVFIRHRFGKKYLEYGFLTFLGLVAISSISGGNSFESHIPSLTWLAFIYLAVFMYHYFRKHYDYERGSYDRHYSGDSFLRKILPFLPAKFIKVFVEPTVVVLIGFKGLFGPYISSVIVFSGLCLLLREAMEQHRL